MSVTSAKSGATGISLALDNNYMEPIATTVVGSSGANVVIFNDIPQTYKHLQIRGIARSSAGTTGGDYPYIKFNSDNTSGTINYSYHRLIGDGATVAASGSGSSDFILGGYIPMNSYTNIYGTFVIDILDYANTNKFKTLRTLNGYDANGSGTVSFMSGCWQNTDAINSITINQGGNNFTQYSRFSLYGIKG